METPRGEPGHQSEYRLRPDNVPRDLAYEADQGERAELSVENISKELHFFDVGGGDTAHAIALYDLE